jgi:hypothetical protein
MNYQLDRISPTTVAAAEAKLVRGNRSIRKHSGTERILQELRCITDEKPVPEICDSKENPDEDVLANEDEFSAYFENLTMGIERLERAIRTEYPGNNLEEICALLNGHS